METAKKESIEELKKRLDEVTEKWKRALADYANLERQVKKERKTVMEFAGSLVITSFLPVLDSLQEATKKSNDSGFDLIIKQFREILQQAGVKAINALGEELNPQLHEAVEVVKGKEDNKVVEVLRTGYKMGNRVLRPARVAVSKKEPVGESERAEREGAQAGDYV